MNFELLGINIRKRRKEKNYTLEQLSEKLDLSTTFIGQIERGKAKPSLETFVKIANILEISTDSLLFGDLNPESGSNHFIKEITKLTENFTTQERELVIQNISAITEYKRKIK